ncbi:MAG: DUF2293 domain-containing protein [Planctomycetes bacterium]|nr:DUF2293 domain-containing protein [Planctomycetota bacterium]
MSDEPLIVGKGLNPRTVRTAQGQVKVPDDWDLLPPGDAALTRRVKAEGACWVMQEKKGRKVFGHGVWAPLERIERLRAELEEERQDPAYTKKLEAGRARRAAEQVEYVEDFRGAVRTFLRFAPRYDALAEQLATAVTQHATPVGSGTVARTERIPIEQRASAAVIAWLRHQTTAYDSMTIARVKGRRREVRRELAEQSKVLLSRYRRGDDVDAASCPLARALGGGGAATTSIG